MTLLPEIERRVENRNAFFCVAPLLGAGAWLALTVGLGIILPYNAFFLGASLLAALIWIFIRRKSLFLPENPWIWCILLAIVIISGIISRGITSTEIDGGLYFPPSLRVHIKCAIDNSTAFHVLFPLRQSLASR